MSRPDPLTLFTLRYGQIPDNMVEPEYPDYSAGTLGWWVDGLGLDLAPEEGPFLPDRDPEPDFHRAREYFEPVVSRYAARLLGVTHDVTVERWYRLSPRLTGAGSVAAYEPLLRHERHVLTIDTIGGRSQTFRDLPAVKVAGVLARIESFDEGSEDSRRPAAMVTMDIPASQLGRGGDDGTPKSAQVHIRIAMITEVLTELRVAPVTPEQVAKMRAAWAMVSCAPDTGKND